MGTDQTLFTKFQALLDLMIEQCKELGPTYMKKFRMDWNEAHKKVELSLTQTERFAVEDAPDEMITIDEYKKKTVGKGVLELGSPSSNGNGHTAM